ncbi:MAG: sulfatase [Saprospirales bacterium TMED214]|nr:MAG: sulfatase [Saprospirales bacterium TMED214]
MNQNLYSRRSMLLGSLALASLLNRETHAQEKNPTVHRGLPELPHFTPRAKRVIYLFQSGGPAQMDLYDYKPELKNRFGEEVPRSIYPDERKTTMSSAQASFPVAPSTFDFKRCGEAGSWISSALPHIGSMADDLCIIRSMHTDAINHDPAITFQQTGSQIPGRPSIGSWVGYGLGSNNDNLPAFVALSSRGSGKTGQPLYDRLWGSGFLPSKHQGVKFRNQGDPVLDISDPAGISRDQRRVMLDSLKQLNQLKFGEVQDPEIETRIAQYELAYRMQMSVPDLLDFSNEPKHVMDLYGTEVTKPGRYAYNCLIARRLAERGVRFIQLFHQGWDQHNNLPTQIGKQCKDTDQPTAALLRDLKQRGMLDDTLIIWGGEFGRTIYSQGKLTEKSYGRDHHPSCFSMWMAGGGTRGGVNHGSTDDYSVNVAENGVSVHDLHATVLHLLGIDHERLIHKFQGRDFRLTDVHGKVVQPLLA